MVTAGSSTSMSTFSPRSKIYDMSAKTVEERFEQLTPGVLWAALSRSSLNGSSSPAAPTKIIDTEMMKNMESSPAKPTRNPGLNGRMPFPSRLASGVLFTAEGFSCFVLLDE